MELCRKESNREWFKEFDYNNNCRGENEKSPAVPEPIPTDEQPFDSPHPSLHEFLFA
jgi:hypothetical protein